MFSKDQGKGLCDLGQAFGAFGFGGWLRLLFGSCGFGYLEWLSGWK